MKNDPPKHLTPAARRLFGRLRDEFGIDDAAGLLLLQSACEAFDRVQQARTILAAEGPITRDRYGMPKPHPACGVERDARTQMHAALRLLKLSPEVVQ